MEVECKTKPRTTPGKPQPRTLQLKLQKSSYQPHTRHVQFFSQLQQYFQQYYIDNNSHKSFLRKIVVKIVVVCEDLYAE